MPTVSPQVLSNTVQAPGSIVPTPDVKQENSIESPPSVPAQPDVKAAQLAALARQEKAMRQHRRALEAERKAFEAQKTQVEAAQNARKEKIKQGDLSFLSEDGVTQDMLTNYLLNGGSQQVDPRLVQLQKELQEIKQQQLESQKAQDEQVNQVKSQLTQNVNALIAASPDEYELIQAEGAQEAVIELMEQMNYTMDLKDAAKEVEDYLLEQATKLAGLKKIKAKFAPPTPEVPQKEEGEKPQQVPTQSTLSNRQAASVPKRLTDKERKERAILAFQGKL